MRLRINPSSPEPIWSQIESGVRRLVAARVLAPGAPVPSVRDLARELRINPATASKAYQRLSNAGVLEVRRGDGTYVTARPPVRRTSVVVRELHEGALRYATLALTLGVEPDDAVESLRAAWSELAEQPVEAGR
jgi:GntR family transcriptional regulator